jgi:hypothetical protein
MRLAARLMIIVLLLCGLPRAFSAELQPDTAQGFERYVRAAEKRMDGDRSQPGRFLYIDSLPSSQRKEIGAELRRGEIYVTRLTTRDDRGNVIRAPDGWIHHWIAAMFVPHTTLQQAVAVDQDYDRYSTFYKPEMVRSRVLDHDDGSFKVYARLQKKTPWLTITLDTYSNVRYVRLDSRHLYSVSRSYRVQQVENAGESGEHLDPPGDGSGFMWAVDVYWRYEAVQGGILVESESIILTRTLPFGLGWIIKPFIHHAAIATEKQLMDRTRQILEQEAKDQSNNPSRK